LSKCVGTFVGLCKFLCRSKKEKRKVKKVATKDRSKKLKTKTAKKLLPSALLAYSRYPMNWDPIRISSLIMGCQKRTKKEKYQYENRVKV
jgi:hypothetical protein